jgi:hypothetical protein
MDKIIETKDVDIVDLGAASLETKGPPFGLTEGIGLVLESGISQD